MNISETPIGLRLRDAGNNPELSNLEVQRGRQERTGTFRDFIQEAIGSVDAAKKDADQKVDDFVMGKTENVHEVMLAMEKANLSFQLMLEIRNRAIETYQEISRMQM